MTVKLELIDIRDKKILAVLLMEYQTEILGEQPGEYKYLDSYWEKENRYPYFIKIDGNIAGFVLINSHTLVVNNAKSISEFYVKKEFRRDGVGTQAASQAFNLFPGTWEVRELCKNPKARLFWTKVIGDITNNNFKEIEMNNENLKGWIQTFNNNT